MTMSVCVFCGSAPGVRPSYSAAARELGAAMAHAGITLVYGGGRLGLMGIVANAVLADPIESVRHFAQDALRRLDQSSGSSGAASLP